MNGMGARERGINNIKASVNDNIDIMQPRPPPTSDGIDNRDDSADDDATSIDSGVGRHSVDNGGYNSVDSATDNGVANVTVDIREDCRRNEHDDG